MSDKHGGPAFPNGVGLNATKTWIGSGSSGMTLRDYFAAKAMQGFFERLRATQYIPHEQIAEDAYRVADAMLKAREL
jgi:hypothetical protein